MPAKRTTTKSNKTANNEVKKVENKYDEQIKSNYKALVKAYKKMLKLKEMLKNEGKFDLKQYNTMYLTGLVSLLVKTLNSIASINVKSLPFKSYLELIRKYQRVVREKYKADRMKNIASLMKAEKVNMPVEKFMKTRRRLIRKLTEENVDQIKGELEAYVKAKKAWKRVKASPELKILLSNVLIRPIYEQKLEKITQNLNDIRTIHLKKKWIDIYQQLMWEVIKEIQKEFSKYSTVKQLTKIEDVVKEIVKKWTSWLKAKDLAINLTLRYWPTTPLIEWFENVIWYKGVPRFTYNEEFTATVGWKKVSKKFSTTWLKNYALALQESNKAIREGREKDINNWFSLYRYLLVKDNQAIVEKMNDFVNKLIASLEKSWVTKKDLKDLENIKEEVIRIKDAWLVLKFKEKKVIKDGKEVKVVVVDIKDEKTNEKDEKKEKTTTKTKTTKESSKETKSNNKKETKTNNKKWTKSNSKKEAKTDNKKETKSNNKKENIEEISLDELID